MLILISNTILWAVRCIGQIRVQIISAPSSPHARYAPRRWSLLCNRFIESCSICCCFTKISIAESLKAQLGWLISGNEARRANDEQQSIREDLRYVSSSSFLNFLNYLGYSMHKNIRRCQINTLNKSIPSVSPAAVMPLSEACARSLPSPMWH